MKLVNFVANAFIGLCVMLIVMCAAAGAMFLGVLFAIGPDKLAHLCH